jgi:hypothetical protein
MIVVSPIIQRNKAIEILQYKLSQVSNIFRKGYLARGRGSLLLYTEDVIKNQHVSVENYRDREESLFLYDDENSKNELAHMIDSYNPKTQGIMMLISSDSSNATWFITVALKSL